MVRAALGCLLVALAVLAPAAAAFEVDERVVPQPVVRYHSALPDWRKPLKRVVKALNRAKVGVRLVETDIAQNASIQVGRLDRKCGKPGIDGTTQTLVGGYALMYLPRGCSTTRASILGAHELGHALGLLHDDDGCALMNSSGTGRIGTPTGCLGRRIPWRRNPWRPDDLAGLERLYRNTPPKLSMSGPSAAGAGQSVSVTLAASDRERNLSDLRIDWGDGESAELDPQTTRATHTYLTPGSYTITAVARDFYLKRGTARLTVTVG